MEDFTWEKIGLMFPEWFLDVETGKEKEYLRQIFPKTPNIKIFPSLYNFSFKDYGIQLWFAQGIPSWIKKAQIDKKPLLDVQHKLQQEVYQEVLKELDEISPTLEKWRGKHLRYFEKKEGWKRNLQDHLDFYNSGELIRLGDYYHSQRGCLTNKLVEIGKLPTDSLNEKWLKYKKLCEYIATGERCDVNSIVGKNLVDCVSRADEIYDLAEEIKGLEF